MGKHTPGPWIVEQGAKTPIYVSPLDRQEEISICHVLVIDEDDQSDGGEWISGEQTKANARLIAAAPDLLDALMQMVAIHDEPSGFDGKYGKSLDKAIEVQRNKINERISIARAAIAKAKGV